MAGPNVVPDVSFLGFPIFIICEAISGSLRRMQR